MFFQIKVVVALKNWFHLKDFFFIKFFLPTYGILYTVLYKVKLKLAQFSRLFATP